MSSSTGKRNSEASLTSIGHSYITQCFSRIKWLEQQIRLLDPNFDLSKGPHVDTDSSEGSSSLPWPLHCSPSATEGGAPSYAPSSNADAVNVPGIMTTGKRPYDSVENSEIERPLSFEARSVAIDLGMLSLHSDSRQKHYLGSSSGLLFVKLIGAGAEAQASSPVSTFPATAHRRRVSPHRPSGEIYHSLYSSLEKVILKDSPVLLKFGVLAHAH